MSELPAKGLSPSCPLCRLDFDLYYRTPRVVPRCGHTYCEKCIAARLTVKANRKLFLCPECTAEVVVRRSVQEDLPKNIGIIDVVKNLRKYSSNEREEDRRGGAENCPQHQRPLELVCESCNFKKICSHCVLFGEHHSHNYRKEAPASSLNLKEVKEVFHLVASSVKLVLLPDSENNLKQSMRTRISEGLKKAVRGNFKQYYDMVERKEAEALQECENIVISEGGIDNSIERLLQDYDRLKSKYELDWTLPVQHGNGKAGKVATVAEMDDFIGRCEDLHTRVVAIQEQAMQHVEKMLKEVGIKVAQAVMFKMQELSFSLKKIVEGAGKEGEKDITSPERRARLKSANSEIKSKSVIEKDEGKGQAQA